MSFRLTFYLHLSGNSLIFILPILTYMQYVGTIHILKHTTLMNLSIIDYCLVAFWFKDFNSLYLPVALSAIGTRDAHGVHSITKQISDDVRSLVQNVHLTRLLISDVRRVYNLACIRSERPHKEFLTVV